MKKRTAAVYNPYKYCPICGVLFKHPAIRHLCNKAVLAAIDGALDSRDPDLVMERKINFSERLSYGFEMLNSCEIGE